VLQTAAKRYKTSYLAWTSYTDVLMYVLLLLRILKVLTALKANRIDMTKLVRRLKSCVRKTWTGRKRFGKRGFPSNICMDLWVKLMLAWTKLKMPSIKSMRVVRRLDSRLSPVNPVNSYMGLGSRESIVPDNADCIPNSAARDSDDIA
jgi:hypothetical protein